MQIIDTLTYIHLSVSPCVTKNVTSLSARAIQNISIMQIMSILPARARVTCLLQSKRAFARHFDA